MMKEEEKRLFKEFIDSDLGYIKGNSPEINLDQVSIDTPTSQTDKIAGMTTNKNALGNSWGLGYYFNEGNITDFNKENNTNDIDNDVVKLTKKTKLESIEEPIVKQAKKIKPNIFEIKNKRIMTSLHSLIKELNDSNDPNNKLAVLYSIIDNLVDSLKNK